MTQSKFKDNFGPNGKDSCLLDTNIVLGFLQQQPNLMKLFQLELSGRPYLVSEITRIELLSRSHAMRQCYWCGTKTLCCRA